MAAKPACFCDRGPNVMGFAALGAVVVGEPGIGFRL